MKTKNALLVHSFAELYEEWKKIDEDVQAINALARMGDIEYEAFTIPHCQFLPMNTYIRGYPYKVEFPRVKRI